MLVSLSRVFCRVMETMLDTVISARLTLRLA